MANTVPDIAATMGIQMLELTAAVSLPKCGVGRDSFIGTQVDHMRHHVKTKIHNCKPFEDPQVLQYQGRRGASA